jgi:hypothetical protein
MLYLPKLPRADGTVYACGGGGISIPFISYEERRRREEEQLENDIGAYKDYPEYQRALIEQLKELREENDSDDEKAESSSVFVPPGSMEWLLHEAGHWIAATPDERRLPNYGLTLSEHGHDGDREWQAWAFEEIILAPWGPSRDFAAPTMRDGAAFAKTGPMPASHLWHIERAMQRESVDVDRWRSVFAEWVNWGRGLGERAPWNSVN